MKLYAIRLTYENGNSELYEFESGMRIIDKYEFAKDNAEHLMYIYRNTNNKIDILTFQTNEIFCENIK